MERDRPSAFSIVTEEYVTRDSVLPKWQKLFRAGEARLTADELARRREGHIRDRMFYGKLCDVVDKIKRLDRKEEPKPSSRHAAGKSESSKAGKLKIPKLRSRKLSSKHSRYKSSSRLRAALGKDFSNLMARINKRSSASLSEGYSAPSRHPSRVRSAFGSARARSMSRESMRLVSSDRSLLPGVQEADVEASPVKAKESPARKRESHRKRKERWSVDGRVRKPALQPRRDNFKNLKIDLNRLHIDGHGELVRNDDHPIRALETVPQEPDTGVLGPSQKSPLDRSSMPVLSKEE